MRLTTYTDYALRVLIYVAIRGEELSTISEISESYGISRNHLTKIVHELGTGGYLETVRGKHGGIRLALAPERINIGEVVRYCEQDAILAECYEEGGHCAILKTCVLRQAFDKALKAFQRELNQYSLADLVKPKKQLAQILVFSQHAGRRPA